MSSLRLTVGRLLAAWKAYPEQRRQLADFASGPPIFISGTHRSGTTWFAKMLAVPGLWYVHEPFNPNKEIWPEAFTYATPGSERPEIDAYFEKLLAGECRETAIMPHCEHSLMPLRIKRPPIRRVMIKDPLACLLTGYLAERFNIRAITVFRHPCGFVSSVLRLGWPIGSFLSQFLDRQSLMEDHLHPFESLMREHRQRDDAAAAAVLHGVLNTVQWNQIRQHPAIRYILFEELCRDPVSSFESIFCDLDLPYTRDTRHRHIRLCTSGSANPADYHTHAVARNSAAMAESWRQQLGGDQIRIVREIWEGFAIPLYRGNEI